MYLVKKRFATACFAAALMIGSSASSLAAPPGQNFDLSNFKLQTPIASGDGVLEINQPELATYTSSIFNTASDGAMVFWTPVTGATTSGSSYPRTELRDLREWSTTSNKTQTGTVKILQAPSTGKIIFAQIHGHVSGSELLKLRWTNGDIRAGVKTSIGNSESQSSIVSGIGIGTQFTYTIRLTNNVVFVTVNNTTKSFNLSSSSWSQDTVYFKAGCYIEDNSGSSSEGGKVAYYAFNGPGSPAGPTAPTFSPAPGTYSSAQNVSISAQSGTTIRYTLNGSTPTTSSTLYSGPINIAVTTTLKAIAINANGVSPVTTGLYTINTGGGGSVTVNSGAPFNNASIASQTGTFTVTYTASVSAKPVDALLGLSNGTETAYSGLATAARFNPSGNIDARNGGAYSAAATIPYSAGVVYTFRMVVNVPSHTYSVYVTPAGGSEVTVASNYAFRTEQNTLTSLNNRAIAVNVSNPGSITVSNFTVQ